MIKIYVFLKDVADCYLQSTGKLFEFSAKILHIKHFCFSSNAEIFGLAVFWLWTAA